MPSVNRVTLIGNLTRDPQLKFLPNQTPVCEFGLAMNRKFKGGNGEDREEVCFIDCAAFGKPAETINQYCQKGKLLYVEGRLKFDTWEDKQGGGKRSKHTVVVDQFQFLGGREGAGGGADDDQRPAAEKRSMAQQVKDRAAARPAPVAAFDESSDRFGDDDIPF